MAISVNHATKVISIPKADTTFISTNATTGYEVRSYDEYAFMRELADYLDSEAGVALPPAFTHATAVTISGVVYARAMSIINGFTITFENGTYQVKLVGGMNNNILDTLNPNSVSVIPANSAGLQMVSGGSGLSAGQDERLARIEKFLRNKQITDPTTGEQTVFEDDNVTVFARADLFEDASGVQRYRGLGAERRERLT